jgi:hypothetical protein
MINSIRRFLMKRDPFLKPPKISDNLFEPLEKPEIKEIKPSDASRQEP